MNEKEETLKTISGILESLSLIVEKLSKKEETQQSPKKETSDYVDEYGSAKECARRFGYSVSGIAPYLKTGVEQGRISKLKPSLNMHGRDGEARYNMKDVLNFLQGERTAR